jgi:Ca2+-binding RTX toxin-like protein
MPRMKEIAMRIRGTANGETIEGTDAQDVLRGMGGNDTINGRGGNDRIEGGLGDDVLSGGAGSDTFAFGSTRQAEHDTITDWNQGDRIDLEGNQAYTLEQVDADTVVVHFTVGRYEHTIEVTGVAPITAADIVIV